MSGLALLQPLYIVTALHAPLVGTEDSQPTGPPVPAGNPPSPSAAPVPVMCAAGHTHTSKGTSLPTSHRVFMLGDRG